MRPTLPVRLLVPPAILSLVLVLHTGAQRRTVFVDVAAPAGVQNTLSTRGACWGDYDADGAVDLYITNEGVATNELYRNNGDGTFTGMAGLLGVAGPDNGQGCAFADYDNDGDLDLYVASLGSGNRLYRNNGDGTFTDVTATAGIDGFGHGTISVAWGDYDGDGCLDIYVGHRYGTDTRSILYRNNCDGTFTNVAPALGLELPGFETFGGWWLDYDNDGDLDLIVAIDYHGSRLFRNNGNGTFSDVTAEAFPLLTSNPAYCHLVCGGAWPVNPMGIAIGDYDNDGDLDLFITGTDRSLHGGEKPSRLWGNNGDGTFTEVTLAAGIPERTVTDWSAEFVDYNNDGWLDLSVVAGGILSDGDPITLYRNNANRTFKDATARTVGRSVGAAIGSAWADYDGNGSYDWYVPNTMNQPNRLFRNQGPVGNYLRIRTVGTVSNRDGIGAVVLIKGGSSRQLRARASQGGILSQSAPEVHFGLGSATVVERVEVTWPSGLRDVITDVAANRTLIITEGSYPEF